MNPSVEVLGWALVHSVWQGALAWAGLELVLARCRRRSAHVRYLAGCAALAFATLAPAVTFFRLDLAARLEITNRASPPAAANPTPPVVVNVTSSGVSEGILSSRPNLAPQRAENLVSSIRRTLRPVLPWLVYGWFAGSAFCCLQLAMGWRTLRQFAIVELAPLPDAIVDAFTSLCRRMQLRRAVRISRSMLVHVPTVVGWSRPVVLWPASMVTGLSPAQVEALLAHELAHIARHDFVVNLLQAVSEALFFYHPAVHAINRHIRREREHACDDVAVGLSRDSLGYAHVLAALESTRAPLRLSLAATGDGDLLSRIRRLLGVPATTTRSSQLVPAAVIGVLAFAVAMFGLPALTARVMTARERIAAIHAAAPEKSLAFKEGDTMFVSGELRATDGSLVNFNGKLSCSVRLNITSYGLALDVREGRFTATVQAGALSLNAWMPGFAPIFAGPFLPDPNTRVVTPITVTIREGHPARLLVLDESGHPVAGAQVSGSAWAPEATPADSRPSFNWTSDERGEIQLGNVDDRTTIDLSVRKSGFQDDQRQFLSMRVDQPIVWNLRRAVPWRGRVVDDITGQPIAGVKVQGALRRTPRSTGSLASPDRDDFLLAITDAEGRFTLDTLNSEWGYSLYLKSPEYAIALVNVTRAATQEFRLSRGLRLAGRVSGLPAGDVTLRCRFSIRGADLSYGHGIERTFMLTGDAGERAFAFDHLPAGDVTLSVGAHAHQLDLQSDQLDVDFDLTTQPVLSATRKVNIHLKPPRGEPSPQGTLEVLRLQTHFPDRPRERMPSGIAVNNGTAIFDTAPPDEIDLRPSRLIGYWFAPRRIKVPTGAQPLDVEIDVVPAGAIQVRLLEPDGRITREANVSGFAVGRPGVNSPADLGINGAVESSGVHTLTPLPFGKRYTIVAHRGLNFTASAPTLIDAEHPFPTVEMKRRTGVAVTGRVVDEEGAPIPDLPLQFSYHPAAYNSFNVSSGAISRRDGSFTMEDINFDAPGHYALSVISWKTWEPMTVKLTRDTPLPVLITLKPRRWQHAPATAITGKR